ncbi:major capsid family protein [Commensalibacter papalotli (ex Servin-Garciduenas et al. 2014)]|uniref:DUF2184 domain-containing protein n=1 Tax=Commensalibacter papalotli (ex Servin-Garciduenas et al. 2014) TaxID=1208583 RepID=W7DPG5_9PROT|nr:major capsid family protein [Commensalibacter papalotli (ex Servin-Garciduenas et al. 2014)]EUK19262.1 hypothetical protein COMX_05910 [Commensalibacter papalotli (ex Servin-Garciduenas et al. 2014)]
MTIQTKSWARDRALLASEFGIHLPNVMEYSTNARVGDSAFTPVSAANNAIPSQFTTYIDPQIIDVLTAPLKAAQIYGEAKKGDWLHDTMMFTVVEPAGDVAAYGDFHQAGYSRMNTNFPQRQQFLVQAFAEWGDREVGRAGLANIDLPSRKRLAAALLLNHWQNQSYFFGVANLQNYGALNDPNLLTPIAPQAKASNSPVWEKATALEIYEDIQALYRQLQSQTQGVVNLDSAVDMDSPLKLVISNNVQAYLLKTNEYGISVLDLLKKNFPNLTQMSAPQLSLDAKGADDNNSKIELVQLFVENYQGIDTFTCAFSEKLRSHGIVRESSSMKEKLTQGSWGTILTRPVLVAQMIGV